MSSGPAVNSEVDLRGHFRAFVRASQRLQASHEALQRRAESIDLELAATNRALQAAIGEKDAILDCLPVGVLAVSVDGTVVWTNPEGERLRRASEQIGLQMTTLDEGECERGAFCVAVRRAPLPDGGSLVVVEDRSRLAKLSREVDRLDRLAGLSELALGVAHEIKNPLNGVMGFASLLESSEDPGEMRRFAVKVRTGLSQVDDIVREMLEFAQAPARGETLVVLSDVVQRAAVAAGVPESRIDVTGDLDVEVVGSALTRVLANLFRNSAEASEGSVRVVVDVALAADHIELRVRDDGPGVDGDLGSTVFQPFVSSKNRGHGLGLALASRVMAFLGGSLELCNPGERGACFRLVLPRPGVGSAER